MYAETATGEEDRGLVWKLKGNQYNCSKWVGKEEGRKKEVREAAKPLKTFQES